MICEYDWGNSSCRRLPLQLAGGWRLRRRLEMPPPPPTAVTAGENADALMRSLRSSIRIQERREGGRDGAQEPGSVQCSMCRRARRSNWCYCWVWTLEWAMQERLSEARMGVTGRSASKIFLYGTRSGRVRRWREEQDKIRYSDGQDQNVTSVLSRYLYVAYVAVGIQICCKHML